MDDRFDYDGDFLVWTERQANALRTLARARADLPNELDLEHVAEEIEDMGRAELNAVRSQLGNILAHLIKLASSPESLPARHWRTEVVIFHVALRRQLTPAMRRRLEIDEVWSQSLRIATAELAEFDEAPLACLAGFCPFAVEELTAAEIDPDMLIARLRDRAEPAPNG